MIEQELQKRKKELKALGRFVVEQHQRRLSAEAGDPSIVGFGRYLQAARKNAGLSADSLAHRAKLSTATVLALEHALIPAQDIHPGWLKRLAHALDERVEDFYLMLGRPNKQPRLQAIGSRTVYFFGKRTVGRLSPLYAVGSTLLICFAVSAIISYSIFLAQPLSTERSEPFVEISAEHRLNRIKAETLLEYQVIDLPAGGPSAPRISCCVY